MPAKEQAKLWAVREVLKEMGEKADQYQRMSQFVVTADGGHPDRRAVAKLFARIDKDPAGWYPGKRSDKVGRPREMSEARMRAISKSMMAAKRRKVEPSYDLACALCPATTTNPRTGLPFSRPIINRILRTECYDEGAKKPWEFTYGRQRRPLTDTARADRLEWAKRLKAEGRDAKWFYCNIIWIDLCSKVIPGNPKKAFEQMLARKNKRKRLMSPDAADKSQNMGGSKTAEKQCSWGDTRVWFGVAMARGKMAVAVFTNADYPGENMRGAAMFIDRLPAMLDDMFGARSPKPRMIFSDRGPGFYHKTHGTITRDYDVACRRHGFKPWAGTNCKTGPHAQPPDIADWLPHETAISWLRAGLIKSMATVPVAWEETPQEFERRLHGVAKSINSHFDVPGLCREVPERLDDLILRRRSVSEVIAR